MTPISRSQEEISTLDAGDECSIAITYNPHDIGLIKKGFTVLESTKNEKYLIVDAIYATTRTVQLHGQKFKALTKIFARAVESYHANPKEFYTTTKPYLGNPSYDEFQAMVTNIQWLDQKALSDTMLHSLKGHAFPTNYLGVEGES
jgi:NitT/TauT family transport system substrate-binding protein